MPKDDQPTKNPTGAPELSAETKKLLEDEGDISEQKPASTVKTAPVAAEPETADEAAVEELDDNENSADEPSADAKRHRIRNFFVGFWRHKAWTLPLTLVVIVAIVLAVPWTRYKVLGTFMTKTFSVEIVDSKNAKPVSGAIVKLDGHTAMTDGQGRARLSAKVGDRVLSVDKKYYQSATSQVFVGIKAPASPDQLKLVATGRQVPLTVIDKLSGKPIANAEIKVLDTSAKTDAEGKAIIVLPTSKVTDNATITASGYNQAAGTVEVTASVVSGNTFSLVPAGRAYFLSNLSGKIDVVSTNFDGSNRATVLAGTGSEDGTTQLFTSLDQKYLALFAKRDDSGDAKLYVVNTSAGNVSDVENTPDQFSPLGWSGDYFIYQDAKPDAPDWQSGATSLKSYNAAAAKAITLTSTSATGSSNADAYYQNIWNAQLFAGKVVYAKTWYQYPGYFAGGAGRQNSIVSVKPDGSDAATLKSADASQSYFSSLVVDKPDSMYFGMFSDNNGSTSYYELSDNGSVTQRNTLTGADLNKDYPNYYVSPNGQHTFWTESRDGQSALFVGDAAGGNGTQVATLDSSFTTYGWNTDNYLLVSKGGSQLYVLPAAGLASGKQPLKVSDYYTSPRYE